MINEYDNIRAKTLNSISRVIKKYEKEISKDVLDFVGHYCDVDEYEMAFEGLVLGLIENKIKLEFALKNEVIETSLALGLDKEAVFDGDFWRKFSVFIEK